LLIQKEKITGDEFRKLFDQPLPPKDGSLEIDGTDFLVDSPLVDLT